MNKRMKNQIVVTKSVSDEDLELINRYTRRRLTADEVYVFSVLLCDNEIDRDGEAFASASLHKFCKLYLGKTGIFDHNPSGENQMARIFKTWIEGGDGKRTQYGEPYESLHAKAYMVRCGRTADLILEIDGGIKKEVSVGCSVAHKLCSICKTDWKVEGCIHNPGKEYGGELCYCILDSPNDAYEWSFVAVPAQPAAGVVKSYCMNGGNKMNSIDQVIKGLDPKQGRELKEYLAKLESQAEAGRAYLTKLKKEVLSLSCLTGAGVEGDAMQSVIEKMDVRELEAFHKAFHTQLDAPGMVQLAGNLETKTTGADSAFKI